ncbi:TPA: glycosyltransferase [Vibrio vulnificus]|nr:glycosyltransferase [Vibrio vulnificus]HAS6223895.1 glycosyltransferase [Vibrio vulnificus]
MMKVMYLTWGETPRSYGVFGSQVIRQFFETANLMPNHEFHMVSGLPLLNSAIVREKLSYFDELKKVRAMLGNVKFELIPIMAPQSLINSSRFTFKLFHFGNHYFLKSKIRKINPDIIHCRSYHATYAAIKVREEMGATYKVIFDTRGFWPEEVCLKRDISDLESIDYTYLKLIEKYVLKHSDRVITVSDTMLEHFKSLGSVNLTNIYLSTEVGGALDNCKYKEKDISEVSLIYVGAIGDGCWHQLDKLKELCLRIKPMYQKFKLTIVTTSEHSHIKKYLDDLSEEELTLVSTKTHDELLALLSNADFGCLPYRDNSSDFEKLVGYSLLGTKTVEYLSAGLPVIANENCGGASSLIKKHGVGLTYDDNNLGEIQLDSLNSLRGIDIFEHCQRIASHDFDYKVNAGKYKNVYFSLVS